ncbi:MAG: transposase [Pirellulaceae bacterium]
MAQLAREELFSPDEIACIHVMNRAVRRCFLLGDDPVSGKNFDHRKRWMQRKLNQHAAYFGIDLLGSAIMSNHFHLVLRSRPDIVATWDDTEVARRWRMLCPLRKHEDGTPQEPTEFELNSIRADPDRLKEVRSRLSDISWWMRLLCQHVGQRANRETGETGKFWESRFRAVRLLDDSAILSAVAYVDLNPIRAGLAQTIEESDFTSAKLRLEALLAKSATPTPPNSPDMKTAAASDAALAPVHVDELRHALGPRPSVGEARCSDKGFLNMSESEYLTLLDWTARSIVPGKSGSTPPSMPPLLQRVGLKPKSWLQLVQGFGELFHHVAGEPHEIAKARSRSRKIRFRVRAKVQQAFLA